MVTSIYRAYRYLFARKVFYPFNKLLYFCSLRGMGILNYENRAVTGEHRFLVDYLSSLSSCTVIDVGANIGDYARAVRKTAPMARIIAFEPHPVTFKQLCIVGKKWDISVHNEACGDVAGERQLFDCADADASTMASLFPGVISQIHGKKAVSHTVNVIVLDDYIKKHRIEKIDLLKIDTEGNEFAVLRGSKESIAKGIIRCIHFEFNEMNVVSRTYFRDFQSALQGWSFYRMLPGELLPLEPYTPVKCEIFAYQNIVAFKNQ